MAIEPGVWGIDLGQCALKALRVENVDGQVTATAFDYVEHPKILSQPDADPDQLIREALEKFLSRNNLRGDVVCISIPGQSGLARFVKLPPVEEKKIPDIVRFEAKQQIPFNLDEVVWDYQKLSSGIVTDGFAMETEIGLFAIKRDTVHRYLQHFKDVGVEVHVVQMAPLALCNYVSYDLLQTPAEGAEPGASKKQCIVALDIGADNSNLVITDGGRIIWQRPIPLGGNHFTRALTKDMKLTFAKAEHLKRNATKSPDLKQILSSLKPVLNDFVGEVQRSLGYFTNTHRDAAVQYMIGLGNAFRLPGLQKFIGEKLQIDIRKLQRLEMLHGEEVTSAPVYTDNVLSFAVAYGLALQGLKVARLQTNLLPQEIQIERMIRAKKPWVVTAAAALLLGTSALTFGYNMQHRAVAADQVKQAMEKGKSVKKTADKYASDYAAVETKIAEDKKGVKSVVIGQDERFNWMFFNQFVNRALPEPDGSNLSPAARKKYFESTGADAFNKFKAYMAGQAKSGEAAADEEEWRDDLIQANVESVYAIYTPDLAGYFNAIKADPTGVAWNSLSKADQQKPPEGKGWLVEVHGYTYHRDTYQFISEVILDNFQSPARILRKPEPAKSADTATAPAPTPATAPAAGTPAPATTPAGGTAPATGGDANLPPPTEDPISGRISHAALYMYLRDTNPEPDRFQTQGIRAVDSLVAGAGGGGGMNPGASMLGKGGGGMNMATGSPDGAGGPGGGVSQGGAGGLASTGWQPLTGAGDAFGGGGMGGMMPGMTGGTGSGSQPLSGGARLPGAGPMAMGAGGPGGGMSQPMSTGMGGMKGGPGMRNMMGPAGGTMQTGGAVPDLTKDNPNAKKAKHTRTEFIILFVWKEPTPSDELLPPEETVTAQPAGGGDLPGSPGSPGGR